MSVDVPRQTGFAHHVLEVGDVGASFEGNGVALLVGAGLRRDLLDVVGLDAELSETVDPVQDGAGVPPVATLRGDHARDQNRAHPRHRPRARSTHVIENAPPIRPEPRIASLEMRPKLRVVIEPPQRGAGKEQVLAPSVNRRLERGDGGGAVAGVIASVDARLGLRKMAADSLSQLQQVVVAFADDHDDAAWLARRG